MSLPDFSSRSLFPTFTGLPELEPPSSTPSWHLLAEVKDNMTIMKPTLVLRDRDTSPFALVFDGLGRDDLDLKKLGMKKGATVVVPRAFRTTPKEEGKRGFVRVEEGKAAEVKAIPSALARVLEVGMKERGREGREDACGRCGEEKEGLSKCTGCARVKYCGKDCQTKDWTEGGHKGDCKIIKALYQIFGETAA